MERLWQDVQYGWRVLQRNPGFAIIAAVTLAIGSKAVWVIETSCAASNANQNKQANYL